jgi:hypothetical protein
MKNLRGVAALLLQALLLELSPNFGDARDQAAAI